jgi:soluble lytic murein transglycosylase-like protein
MNLTNKRKVKIMWLIFVFFGAGIILFFLSMREAKAATFISSDYPEYDPQFNVDAPVPNDYLDYKYAVGEPMDTYPQLPYQNVFKKYANMFDVDWRLLAAIAFKESSFNALAVNKTDNESLGLMQILCQPDGRGHCSNNFNVDGWPDSTRSRLLEADWNVYIGSQIIAWNINNYGLTKGVAVYNNWNARNQSPPFSNQNYVDSVLKRYRSYQQTYGA